METKTDRLIAVHTSAGAKLVELASFTCPKCGERPMLFAGNQNWNEGMPIVECLCLAPFSPRKEVIKPEHLQTIVEHPEHSIWQLPPVANADEWGMFVAWKRSLPEPDEEEEEQD